SPAMNIGTFRLIDGHAALGDAKIPLTRATVDAVAAEGSDQVTLGFRPEALEVVSEGTEGAFPVVVDLVEELGSDAFLHGEAEVPTEGEADVELRITAMVLPAV